MPLSAKNDEPLEFPINGKTYTVHPVGIDDGIRLLQILGQSPQQLAKSKLSDEDLFKLALGEDVWDAMRADRVPLHLTFRAGLAALAYFQADNNLAAAERIWESGIDPERVAAYMAAQEQTTNSPSTAADAASTASTSGTSSPTRTRSKSTRSSSSRKSRA